jgi:large subunit ribosomal protein L21
MDYAVLRTGGRQYRIKPGDLIDVDKLPAEEGSYVQFSDVLAVSKGGELTVGNPLVGDASVLAQVRSQYLDRKILVFKYKRKTRYRRKKGHRQPYTRLYITSINLAGEEIGVPVWPGSAAIAEAGAQEGEAGEGSALTEPEEEASGEPAAEVEDTIGDEGPLQAADGTGEDDDNGNGEEEPESRGAG